MFSAWQIAPSEPKNWRSTDCLDYLQLKHDLERPVPGPNQALVRIKAAALNARDMMVIAKDPVYPITTMPYLTPCADGAGVIDVAGPGSQWKCGDRVVLCAMKWDTDAGVPTLEESRGMGAGCKSEKGLCESFVH
jgi:NADPH:quinone reductase-like Zn-dependent oxidoreductase